MKPRSAKQKGRNFQQKIVQLLCEHLKLDGSEIRSVPASVTGEDIWFSDLARKRFPFSIEAKKRETLNIWGALEQAENNAPKGITPLLVFSRNRYPTYVALRFEDFLDILSLFQLEKREPQNE